MTTLEILRAARVQFETRGLWQGDKPETARANNTCVANACTRVSSSKDLRAPRLLSRLLGDERQQIQTIFDWNDTPGRTVQEVLALFDRAIAAAEAVEQEHAPVHLDAAVPERLPEVMA
jgi:hypothetical protein